MSTTICAIATAQGGAIGVIRLSGSESLSIADKIFISVNGNKLADAKPRTVTYGSIKDENGNIVDDVLVTIFNAPYSYTGEDSVEISCHGSKYILQKVIELLIANGCNMAKPGEYTQRAFLNGKMDLSQAEAVADLIASSNAASHKLAMSQMRGGFSVKVRELRDKLLNMTTLLELELDFSEEDVEFADRHKIDDIASDIEIVLSNLKDSFKLGNAIKNGIPVAIVGETNVGKSTLLNQLLHEERAIVSNIHGTTRDSIEDTINIQGVNFRFIDTAGIRDTQDIIENAGIQRTFDKIKTAEIILWILDAQNIETQSTVIEQIKNKISSITKENTSLLCVLNKCDLISEKVQQQISNQIKETLNIITNNILFISAKTGFNIDKLEDILIEKSHIDSINTTDVIVTNARHVEALTNALKAIQTVRNSLQLGITSDLISEDLRLCLHHLSEIIGEMTSDEVIQNVFKNFCVGK